MPGTDSLVSYSLGEDGTGLFACGRTASGRALCWGSDRFGQLGVDGVDPSGSPIPSEVAGARTFRDVRAGFRSACAVDLAGNAWCWGENGAGRLGDGTLAPRRTPGAVLSTAQFATVSTGESMHACALTDRGAAHCWGANDYGQLGIGTQSSSATPITVRSSPLFSSIVAGTDHSCGLTPSGEAWCWGRNDAGQLGGAANLSVPEPVRVVTTVRFKKLSLGRRTTCGIAMDDTLWCWGSNDGGLLGRGL